jgi:hypothetical protein
MLAVFERIDASTVERLLTAASQESTLPFVGFRNQPAARASVPDAAIWASFHYLFEIKVERAALSADQLLRHLKILDGKYAHELLFVITPDAGRPEVVDAVNDGRLVWLSFRDLDQAIAELLSDPTELVSSQARFLLHELRALFAEEGLTHNDDTVVVAARNAYPEFLRIGAYICQPGRSFRAGIERMAFYADGAIQTPVPRIRFRRDDVIFTPGGIQELSRSDEPLDQELGKLISDELLDRNRRDQPWQVFLLTRQDSPDTIQLPRPIRNTTTDRNGRGWAWTLSQRYVRAENLTQAPGTTAELDEMQSST